MIPFTKFILLALIPLVTCEKPGPQAIKNFYDTIFGDVGAASQNMTLLRETFAEDWNTRPNPLNPTGKGPTSGPFPEGMSKLLGLWSVMFKDVKIDRQHTLMCSDDTVCGTPVAMLSKFSATVGDLPPGFEEYPVFPGIDPAKIKGKRFHTMAIDIQVIKDGLIKRTWHFEDFLTATEQLLNDTPAPRFDNPRVGPGQALSEVPQAIKNFYDKVLSDTLGQGQNDTLLAETMHPDYNVRPNPFAPQGLGPNRDGFKKLAGAFGTFIPNTKFERQHTFLCGDRVAVLSKFTGTVNPPEGTTAIPFFPGISIDKIKGKSFETATLDIHLIKDGLTKQAWHLEDWASAVDQMVNDKPAPDMGFDDSYIQY